jgi:hypothetical protein
LVPKRMLVKISRHLLSATDRIEVPARRTEGQISRAQGALEQLLGALPLKGEYPPRTPLEHLEEANALAQEHLALTGPEADLAQSIRLRALSEARKEL